MKSTRNGTFVQARELEPGMVVEMTLSSIGGDGSYRKNVVVKTVDRAADEVERLRLLIGKTKQRRRLEELVEALKRALGALDFDGREARIIVGHSEEGDRLLVRTANSQEDFRYIRQQSVR